MSELATSPQLSTEFNNPEALREVAKQILARTAEGYVNPDWESRCPGTLTLLSVAQPDRSLIIARRHPGNAQRTEALFRIDTALHIHGSDHNQEVDREMYELAAKGTHSYNRVQSVVHRRFMGESQEITTQQAKPDIREHFIPSEPGERLLNLLNGYVASMTEGKPSRNFGRLLRRH